MCARRCVAHRRIDTSACGAAYHTARACSAGGDRVPYSDGVYEHTDGSPVDITESLAYGEDQVGGGSDAYARGWDRVFGSKTQAGSGDAGSGSGGRSDAAGGGQGRGTDSTDKA